MRNSAASDPPLPAQREIDIGRLAPGGGRKVILCFSRSLGDRIESYLSDRMHEKRNGEQVLIARPMPDGRTTALSWRHCPIQERAIS